MQLISLFSNNFIKRNRTMEQKQDHLLSKSVNNKNINVEQEEKVKDKISFLSVLKYKSFSLILPYYALLEIASYQRFVFMAAYGAAFLSGCHTIKQNNNCHGDFKYDEYNIYYNYANSVAGLLAFLFAGFIGGLSDTFGRKPFMIFQIIITAIPYIIMLFYNNLYVFLGLWCLIGINGSTIPTTPISNSIVADTLPENARILGYGFFYILAGIGLGGGALLGFLTAKLFNDHFNFYVITILFILALIYLIICVPETLSNNKPVNKYLFKNPLSPLTQMCKNPIIKWMGILYLFINLPDVGIAGIVIPVFSDVYHASNETQSNMIGLKYLGGLAIGLPFSSMIVLPFLKRYFNDYAILIITILLLMFAMLAMSLVLVIKKAFMIPIVGFIFGHSYICLAASSSILSKYTLPNERGIAFGIVAAMTGITNIIAPSGFAISYHYLRENHLQFAIFLIALVLVIIALIIVLFPLKSAINAIHRTQESQVYYDYNNKSSSSLAPGANDDIDS